MSIDSRSDSNSSAKGKGSRLFKKPAAGDVAGAFKKDIGKLGDITRNFGNTIQSVLTSGMKKDTPSNTVYSTANRELGSDGFDVYNIEGGMEIFISKVSDSAIFDQDQEIIRATDGHFVGSTVKPVKPSDSQANEGSSGPADMRSLFKNVHLEDKRGQEIRGSVGIVQDGVLVQSSPSNQVPEGATDILNRIQRAPKVEYEEVSVLNEDGTVETVPAEGCITEVISQPVAETPAVDVPVIEESVVTEKVEAVPEVPAEVPETVDAEPIEGGDIIIRPMPEIEDVPNEAPVVEESPVEPPVVDVPVTEAPVEAPVEAKPKDEFFIDSESESPVEAPVIEEPAEAPTEEFELWKEDINLGEAAEAPVTEKPVEAPVTEAPLEVVPSLPKMEVGGLDVEGCSEINAAVAVGDEIAFQETESAETSADATPASEHKPLDIEAERKELTSEPEIPEAPKCPVIEKEAETVTTPVVSKPKVDYEDENKMSEIADPVVHRPRRYNYRAMKFTNGKLENISKKDSDEGVQRIAGQTSPRSAPVERLPSAKPRKPRISIDGDVGSIMRLTLPELDLDDDSCTVDFECIHIPEDGMEAICFAEPPRMEIPSFEFPALSAPESVPALNPAMETPRIASAPETLAIGAATETVLIPAVSVVPVTVMPASESEDVPEPATSDEMPTEEPVVERRHAVVFSFGGSGSEGSVCFSF